MFIKNELSYDAFRVNLSNIYRVTSVQDNAAIMIALVTVSFQAIKAAIANPVKSLRTE
jgi:putative ABC transport system permease protein